VKNLNLTVRYEASNNHDKINSFINLNNMTTRRTKIDTLWRDHVQIQHRCLSNTHTGLSIYSPNHNSKHCTRGELYQKENKQHEEIWTWWAFQKQNDRNAGQDKVIMNKYLLLNTRERARIRECAIMWDAFAPTRNLRRNKVLTNNWIANDYWTWKENKAKM
jgi:hypothetical protein